MKTIFVTGGHYTPAKAVINEFKTAPDIKIFYVGTKYSFEGDKAVSYEYLEMSKDVRVHFLSITAGRLQPRFFVNVAQSLVALGKIPVGFVQSLIWILKFHPSVVISFGGYIALPVVVAAWLNGIPIVTHEQTRAFGLANRIIQLLSKKICVGFRSSLPENPGEKWVFTGNPVRREIFQVNLTDELKDLKSIKQKEKIPLIYVTGGKQGAHILNETIAGILPELLQKSIVIIQTGDNQQFKDYDKLELIKARLDKNLSGKLLVKKFVTSDEIGAVFSLGDLVIGRAGANTVFDLAVLGLPAILVPIPWSRANEQYLNAQELARVGLAQIVLQENIGQLYGKAVEMLSELPKYKKHAPEGTALVVQDSAEQIARLVLGFSK